MKISDFFFLISVNIQNSLCGLYERHGVRKKRGEKKKRRLSLIWLKNKHKHFSIKYLTTKTQLPKMDKYKKNNNSHIFSSHLKMYTSQSPQIHHIIMTELYPSHDKSLKMLHYS